MSFRLDRAMQQLLGILVIDDDLVDECRRNVMARCETVDVSKYRRRQAQEALEAEAKLAIVDTFHERAPGREYRVGRIWPGADVTIHRDLALVEIWLGNDYRDDGDGIEPVRVSVFRSQKKQDLGSFLSGLVSRKKPEQPLELTVKAPPAPAPAQKSASSARAILDRNKR